LGQNKIEKHIEEIKDSLYIEDLSGRISILGNYQDFKVEEFISGIPIAIKGKLNQQGIFLFDEFTYYNNIIGNNLENPERENNFLDVINEEKGERIDFQNFDTDDKSEERKENDNSINIFPRQKNIPNNENKNLILFLSNLNLGKLSEYTNGIKPSIRTLLIDFIQNQNNMNNILYQLSNRISRIILVGNSLNTFETDIEKENIFNSLNSKSSIANIYKNILENYLLFNNFLNIISNYIYIDVMPSMNSYDDLKYPQAPLSELLFTENIPNINLSSLNLVSNPYFFNIFIPSLNKMKYFIGTSGENINIIKQYSCYENNLDIMKKQIEWGHLCPINPSHLTLFSLDNKNDPLIIDKIPDIYFTSGNKKLNYEKINIYNKEVVLLSLPDFVKTSKFALFNYEDNSVIEIDFSFEF
jgi:hypothetical protein